MGFLCRTSDVAILRPCQQAMKHGLYYYTASIYRHMERNVVLTAAWWESCTLLLVLANARGRLQ